MADTEDPKPPAPDGKKKPLSDREKAQVEPVPKRDDFFLWLERLFYEAPENAAYPEKIDVRVVEGKAGERLRSRVKQYIFGPNDKKPTKDKIVNLSNEILHIVQRDCDVNRRELRYGVHAWHFNRGEEPYDRFLIRCKPSNTYSADGEGIDPRDDPETQEERFSSQVLKHQEQMVGLLGAGYEGMIDRSDRQIERSYERIEKLETRNERLFDMLEKALSLEEDRAARREWRMLGMKAAEKGLDMGLALAPPLLNQLVGKDIIPTDQTAETFTLKRFFTLKEQGGLLTQEQSNAAFGVYDDTPEHNLVKPGVLTLAQAKLLYDVAHGKEPPDALDRLLPGGDAAISQEQVTGLLTKCGFAMEQIAPLQLIFEARMRRKFGNGAAK